MERCELWKALGVGCPGKGQQGSREGLLRASVWGSMILREAATVMRETQIFRMFYCSIQHGSLFAAPPRDLSCEAARLFFGVGFVFLLNATFC